MVEHPAASGRARSARRTAPQWPGYAPGGVGPTGSGSLQGQRRQGPGRLAHGGGETGELVDDPPARLLDY